MFNLFKKQKEKEQKNKAISFGVLVGVVEAVYVAFVVFLMNSAQNFLPNLALLSQFSSLMLALLVFVVSAGISALLVFGYPAYLIFNKEFKAAITASVSTIVTLIVIGIMVVVIGTAVV